jgi:transcriptional regulator with GAF, ATPase, and Fis domain
VDRTFNPEAYEYRKTLNTFSREMISLNRLEDLTRGLCETVSRALDVRSIVVVLKEGRESPAFKVAASQGLPGEVWAELLRGSDALADRVGSHRGPFAPERLAASPDTPEEEARILASMREAHTSLVVPIHKEEELLGWISLGEKRSDALYTSEDRDLLETLANQASMAVTNALAFEEIDGLNRDLREKMAKVEEQRSEILQLQERLLDENRYLKEEIGRQYDFTEIVGATHGLRHVMATVEKAAESDATILVCGESGTGKELVARAIHYNSHLRDGPFIKVNCAALPEGVLQSELFGHEKGAFTGAHERRTGRFELANGGTIFLDEIGDISTSTQVLLLRVLQEQEFERVGGSEPIKVRVRVIAATNRNLEALVAEDRFRMDLYYRLKVITIEVPPLRDRQSDILELSLHFVRKYAQRYGKRILKLDDPVIEQLKRYAWPGNVRELENIIERAVVLSRGESLSLGEIPMELKTTGPPGSQGEAPERGRKEAGSHTEVISEIERQRLSEALERAGGNKSEAARSLGLKRSTFFNKLKRYGLLTT